LRCRWTHGKRRERSNREIQNEESTADRKERRERKKGVLAISQLFGVAGSILNRFTGWYKILVFAALCCSCSFIVGDENDQSQENDNDNDNDSSASDNDDDNDTEELDTDTEELDTDTGGSWTPTQNQMLARGAAKQSMCLTFQLAIHHGMDRNKTHQSRSGILILINSVD
jgi:hypothetical protein